MKRLLLSLFFIFLLSILNAQAQPQTVSIGTTETNVNAVLWLKGNGSQAFIIPVGKKTSVTPEEGMLIFDSDDRALNYYNGQEWISVIPGTGSGIEADGVVGNEVKAITDAGGLELTGSGTVTSPLTLGLVKGTADGQLLKWNNTTAKWELGTDNSGAASTADNVTLEILGGTLRVKDAGITDAKIAGVAPGKLTQASATTGQVLKWNGTAWAPAADAGGLSSTLTSSQIFVGNTSNVATGVAMSGDATITNTGAVTIANNAINSTKIADGTITGADLSPSIAIATSGSVTTSDLNINTINYTWPATNAVGLLNNDGSGNLTWSPTTIIPIALDGLTDVTVSTPADAQVLIKNGTGDWTNRSVSGDVTLSNTGAVSVANTATAGTNIVTAINNGGATGTINAARIGNLDASKITTGSLPVTRGGTGGATFTGVLIGNGTSPFTNRSSTGPNQYLRRNSGNTDYEFGTVAIASPEITDGTIADIDVSTSAAIAGTKINPNFGAQNITTTGALTSGPISTTDMDINTLNYTWPNSHNAAGAVLTNNGTGTLTWSTGASGWGLTGNAATTPATNFVGTSDAQDLVFRTNNTEKLRIQSGGNVGIGIAAPLSLLDVRGPENSSIDLSNTANTIKYRSAINSASGAQIGTVTNHKLDIFTNNLPVMTISTAGNVGIGTSVPANPLDVFYSNVSSSNPAISIDNNAGGGQDVFSFKFSGVTQASLRKANTGGLFIESDNNIEFFNNGVPNLAVLSTGNVGVGTQTPSERLDVVGNLRFSGALMAGNLAGTAGQVLTSQGSGTAPIWSNAGSGWGLTGNSGINAATNFIGTTDAQDLAFRTNGAERLRILSSGNVGIGTTTPGQQLEVFSTSNPTTIRVKNSLSTISAQAFIEFGHDDGSGGFVSAGSFGDPGSGDYLQLSSTNNLAFITNFSERMTITTNGNVGIGTTNANAPLQFANTFGNRKIVLNEFANNDHEFFGFGVDANGLRYQVNTGFAHVFYAAGGPSSSGELFRIAPGYVGIAGSSSTSPITGSPPSVFDVNIDVGSIGGGMHLNNSDPDGATYYGYAVQGASRARTYLDGTSGDWRVNVSGADRMAVLAANGRVGIGTNSPEQALDVVGYLRIGAGTGTANEGLLLASPAPGFSSIIAGGRATSEFQIRQPNAAPMTFSTSALERMRIDAAGKVGIGTVAPVTELHVVHANGTPATQSGFTISNLGGSQAISLYVSNGTGNLGLYNEDGSPLGSFDDSNGTYTAVSDKRLKKNIHSIESVLPKIKDIRIHRYHFKKQADDEQENIGVIAQELKQIYPELVKQNVENGYFTVDYMSMTPLAIKAIQEQQNMIDSLQTKIREIETKLMRETESKQKLEAKLDNLSKEVEQIKQIISTSEARKE